MEHHHRSRTYTLRFIRNKHVLDAEIHQSLESVGAAAVNYVMAFGAAHAYPDMEMLLLGWDEVEGPLIWNDDEYEIVIESNPARHVWNDNNDCQVIPFKRKSA
jgi:hypothetical protein